MTRILSIDGGGIRGLVPAVVLAEIEERSGRPICDLFDLIAGTSTGGILALGLTLDAGDGTPKYAAADMVDLYVKEGPRIFHRPLAHRIRSVESLLEEKYPSDGIEEVLQEYFADARLSDALTDVLVPSYDIEARQPYFFKSTKARKDPTSRDHPLWHAARATSAAPTYFEPFPVPKPDGRRVLVDGGVFVNNPAVCALVEALSARGSGTAADDLVVSLGTAEATDAIPYEDARGWGLAGWAQPVLNVMMDGVSDAGDYQVGQLLPPIDGGEPRYVRLQARLRGHDVPADMPQPNTAMDDVSDKNLLKLRQLGEWIVEHNSEAIDALVTRLETSSPA